MRVYIDMSYEEGEALLAGMEAYVEHHGREYLSSPNEDDPGRRIDMVRFLGRVMEAVGVAWRQERLRLARGTESTCVWMALYTVETSAHQQGASADWSSPDTPA